MFLLRIFRNVCVSPSVLCNVGVVRSQGMTIHHQALLPGLPLSSATHTWDWFFVPRSLAFGYFNVVPDLFIDLIY